MRLLACLCAAALSSCCLFIRPPDAQELLDTGFRSPEQTVRTFQVGWRAELPDLERRCFSSGFLERNHVSRLNYREYRARLLEQQPFLRLGIADARLVGTPELHGERALLRAQSHGRTIEFDFVLDDFVEAWAGTEIAASSYAPFAQHHTLEALPDGTRRLWGFVELPAGQDEQSLTELRVGREWKIDGLRVVEEN